MDAWLTSTPTSTTDVHTMTGRCPLRKASTAAALSSCFMPPCSSTHLRARNDNEHVRSSTRLSEHNDNDNRHGVAKE
eukprot:1158765-Pelagomonas_calceolata.AAC.8